MQNYNQKNPKINVIIWKKEAGRIIGAFTSKRAVVHQGPNGRWIGVSLNGEVCLYSSSCGLDLEEVPKHKIPRDFREISVDQANSLW